MRISFEKWISIEIKSDVKIEVVKIYSLKLANRKIVNEVFDKLHAQKRIKYISQSTSYEYSIFVVWRIVIDSNDSKRKKRAIINIRDFNKIAITNSYLMSFQSDIIFVVVECKYISVFDVVEFFYQWLIRLADKHKLIVVFHRSQKQFNVTMMKFKNSSTYIQKKIDDILRAYSEFAKIYVNDIVVFSQILKKHLTHLSIIFQVMNFYGISFSSKKSFLSYFTVALLSQKIDAFDFSIVSEKLDAIARLNFSYTFKNLKIYFDLIDWLRKFIVFYVQKANALQQKKRHCCDSFHLTKTQNVAFFSSRLLSIIYLSTSSNRIDNYKMLFLKFYFWFTSYLIGNCILILTFSSALISKSLFIIWRLIV